MGRDIGDLALIQPRALHDHHRPLIVSPSSIQRSTLSFRREQINVQISALHFDHLPLRASKFALGSQLRKESLREGKVESILTDAGLWCVSIPSIPHYFLYPMSCSCPILLLVAFLQPLLRCPWALSPTHAPQPPSPRPLSPIIGCQRIP